MQGLDAEQDLGGVEAHPVLVQALTVLRRDQLHIVP